MINGEYATFTLRYIHIYMASVMSKMLQICTNINSLLAWIYLYHGVSMFPWVNLQIWSRFVGSFVFCVICVFALFFCEWTVCITLWFYKLLIGYDKWIYHVNDALYIYSLCDIKYSANVSLTWTHFYHKYIYIYISGSEQFYQGVFQSDPH